MEAKPNGCVGELKNELIEMLKGVVVPELSGIQDKCIYRVPPRIRQVNPQAYTPQIISIGPFHNPLGSSSDNILHKMEPLKLKYLKGFLDRTKVSVDDLVIKFQEWENKIRSCYAEIFSFNSNDFLKIIIIDACFIIELFLRFYKFTIWMKSDPIFLRPRIFEDIRYDLTLLENQLPFFVLDDIYKLASINLEFPPFLTITLHYFRLLNLQNIDSVECPTPKHFIDLLRTLLLPSSFDFEQEGMGDPIEHVYSVSQLSEAGLVFEPNESKNLLDLNFDDKGVLKMPCLYVDHTTESYLRNILAYEECHMSDVDPRYISQYLIILDFLISTEKDVSILVDKKIIVNQMRDANEVATMINNLSKNVSMPIHNAKYMSLCHKLNGFYKNPINKYKAIFVHEYFNTPWKIASTLAAVLLLLLTLIQTNMNGVGLRDTDSEERVYTPIVEIFEEEIWTKEVKDPKTVFSNVLQIPKRVIENCSLASKRSIFLYDQDGEDGEELYECVLNKRSGEGIVEMYVTKGWYEYARAQNLKVGDVLHFLIRYPPPGEIIAYVERANAGDAGDSE